LEDMRKHYEENSDSIVKGYKQ